MVRIFTFDRKLRRKRRVSLNIRGTSERPRISVFRSNRYIYAQAIDDENGKTLASFSSLILRKGDKRLKKTEEAKMVGLELAKILREKKINRAIFDRGRYQYHGRVAALCAGLGEGGIEI
jgi:large subunit ribosomal protein L18